jgi:hypothetical protein
MTLPRAYLLSTFGRFLWVSLQLDSICSETCDDDIRRAIETLPRDLTETFSRILKRSSVHDKKAYTLEFSSSWSPPQHH